MRRIFLAGPIVAALTFLAACSGEESGPYIAMSGGSFMFNYRIAEATAGFVLAVLRPLPAGALIEATLQNPAGGDPIVLKETAGSTQKRYDFVTPALHGIKKDVDYPMVVRVIAADGKELQKLEKNFRSNVGQDVLPEKPLTIGPGYTPNPQLPAPNTAVPAQ